MSILSDRDIKRRLEAGNISIDPEIRTEQIQPGSLDVRMGESYSNEYLQETYEDVDEIVIEPLTFYLGHTLDYIEMPRDLSAMVSGRSSWGREGLIIHATAGWIDSSFNGQITLEIFNLSNKNVVIEPGERIGQLVFFEMSSEPDEAYDEKELSKYSGQTGPTRSRMD